MSPAKERKNRFQVSREVQEEFVNGIAETMLSLTEKAGKWQQGWTSDTPVGMPFCPVTGREYSGANMVRLLLASIARGYADDRWMTFRQIQTLQEAHPELKMNIRKGEHGVKVLRPEEVAYIVEEDGSWKFLGREELRRIEELRAQGAVVPDVERRTLFYPFTVFNAAQIEGFPAKEQPAHTMTEIERNELVERFIASSGVIVKHYGGDPLFSYEKNEVSLPYPDRFSGTDEYYAAKLHEFFHATGHESRENRQQKKAQTLKGYAFEEMRAEMFSMLAGAHLRLPMPETNSAAYIAHWNKTFSGGDAKAVFQAASEAARILTMLHQFEVGEQPSARWFPKSESWPELIELQMQRDVASGVFVHEKEDSGTQIFERTPQSREPAEPLSLDEAAVAFKGTDNPVSRARIILQSPDFLDLALREDPHSMLDLARLCDRMAHVLHLEADEKMRTAPGTLENPEPLQEQRAAAAQRMRL